MKNIRVDISDSKNRIVNVAVSTRLAETYLKIVYGTANEKPEPSDTIKAVQYLASNGRDNIPAPQSKDALINLMLTLIEKQHFGLLEALREAVEPPKGYFLTDRDKEWVKFKNM